MQRRLVRDEGGVGVRNGFPYIDRRMAVVTDGGNERVGNESMRAAMPGMHTQWRRQPLEIVLRGVLLTVYNTGMNIIRRARILRKN